MTIARASGRRRDALRWTAVIAAGAVTCSMVMVVAAGRSDRPGPRTFATPEQAVSVLIDTVRAGDLPALVALFGPDGQDLVDTSDSATGRRNREVFVAAVNEGWQLAEAGADRKELTLGNEAWPFPVPLVKRAEGWSFDAAAGREEILARRIGRNELAVIGICQTYVKAQRAYALTGHEGKPAGRFARRFGSEPGTHNGLYWPAARGERRGPLGDLIAQAEAEGYTPGRGGREPAPLHGYYFRILDGQGPAAPGGVASYVVDGALSGGFALIAWPAHYDASGVMTFIVNQDGRVYEKDLGPDTRAAATGITRYDPDATWHPAVGDRAARP
jgi:hypothetical protein